MLLQLILFVLLKISLTTMSRHVHEIKLFHILKAAQKVLSGSGSQWLVVVGVRELGGTNLLVLFPVPSFGSAHWVLLSWLVAEQRQPSAFPSPPSISVINLSAAEKRNC